MIRNHNLAGGAAFAAMAAGVGLLQHAPSAKLK
jgi:hypothetical protein